ncbi:DUF551 domain-containing protein [Raoultella ornithinolytica]|uniref:DUF551 domain-containing protein n=2 Tax=Klebsiella/Raoultella group TaxID=2890311 RepID=UPI0039B3D326
MTKSTITRERAQQIFLGNGPEPSASEERELARMTLVAMDSEPVALQPELAKVIYHFRDWNEGFPVERFKADYVISWMLANYPPAPPAPVVAEWTNEERLEFLSIAFRHAEIKGDLEMDDICLGIKMVNACRAAMLQAGNCRENRNSSTNNCREIAETSTGTAITPAAPDKKLTDDVLDEIIAGAKTSMEQYLALSLKAEREVWRKEGPTDDERIMAIEGIHKCERCGDEGWVVGEMGITRCACGQAAPVCTCPSGDGSLRWPCPSHLGNSPVIPEGCVMVPREPTEEMNKAGWAAMNEHDAINPTYRAMIAAAAHDTPALNSIQSVVTVPGKWIPVSERMPDDEQEVLTINKMGHRFVSFFDKHSGLFFDRLDAPAACCIEHVLVTHWMPLPAAPQEVK